MQLAKQIGSLSQARATSDIVQSIALRRPSRNSKLVGGKKEEANGESQGAQRRRSRVKTRDKSADGLSMVCKGNNLPVPKPFDSPLYKAAGNKPLCGREIPLQCCTEIYRLWYS